MTSTHILIQIAISFLGVIFSVCGAVFFAGRKIGATECAIVEITKDIVKLENRTEKINDILTEIQSLANKLEAQSRHWRNLGYYVKGGPESPVPGVIPRTEFDLVQKANDGHFKTLIKGIDELKEIAERNKVHAKGNNEQMAESLREIKAHMNKVDVHDAEIEHLKSTITRIEKNPKGD